MQVRSKQFHKLTGSEDFAASVATGSEFFVVATSAVDAIGFRSELFVDERLATVGAQETGFVPMFVFVGQILSKETKKNSIKL